MRQTRIKIDVQSRVRATHENLVSDIDGQHGKIERGQHRAGKHTVDNRQSRYPGNQKEETHRKAGRLDHPSTMKTAV